MTVRRIDHRPSQRAINGIELARLSGVCIRHHNAAFVLGCLLMLSLFVTSCAGAMSDGISGPKSAPPTPAAPLENARAARMCTGHVECELGEVCRIGRCGPR